MRSAVVLNINPVVEEHPPEDPKSKKPKYKPENPVISLPVVDNFPLAAAANSASEIPSIASWNAPPSSHVPENTPLFIGFTRNWRLLQQVVVSYITSGWPPEDIYVVENTGVMNSNKNGLLSLQNPFFLNHTRLDMLGVTILITPTLFTFAQLQNYYLYTSIQNNWAHYFWSHMDIVAVSYEDPAMDPLHDHTDVSTIYTHCLSSLREALTPDPETGKAQRWAMRFFSYDQLALVNVAAFIEVGGWDTMIPFYMTDCDMHARLEMALFSIEELPAGLIYDVASGLDDLLVLYRKDGIKPTWTDPSLIDEDLQAIVESEAELGERSAKDYTSGPDTPNSPAFFKPLLDTLDRMQTSKHASSRGRNTWQGRQTGGIGEPFYRDSAGFEKAIGMTIEHGRAVFREKWGHRDCDIVKIGLEAGDAWRMEHDW